MKKLSQIIPVGLFFPVVFFLLAILSFPPAMTSALADMDTDLATKVAAITPIRGMCYSPTPSDYMDPGAWSALHPLPDKEFYNNKYFDTDFTNSTFPGLWGNSVTGARGDLEKMANDLKVNFLHLYDWSAPTPPPNSSPGNNKRNHIPFLDKCQSLGIKVTIPISNYFLKLVQAGDASAKGDIQAMVNEAYQGGSTPHPAAAMWCMGNEIFVSGIAPEFVATSVQYIIEKEESLGVAAADRLLITAPVTFGIEAGGPSIGQIQRLEAAFKANAYLAERNVWEKRFIAAPQPQNSGSFLRTYIDTTFSTNFPDVPFFFGEVAANINDGGGTEAGQATWVAGQIKDATTPTGNFIGMCVFQWKNRQTLAGPEKLFGINKFGDPPNPNNVFGTISDYYPFGLDKKYPIDPLVEKPSYESVRKQWAVAVERMAVGDLDGNGKADLIADKNSTWVYMNDSTWTRITTTSPGPNGMVCGDLNGNGESDLIGQWNGTWVYMDDNSWKRITTDNPSAGGMVTGDLDGNGLSDLIGEWNGTWVYMNDSSWTRITTASPGAGGMVTGDLDGNGQADLIGDWSGTWAYMNNSTWTRITTASPGPGGMATGDLDGDGQADLIGDWSGTWAYMNNSTWARITSASPGPGGIVTGDLDGDGKSDLIGDWNGIWAYMNNSTWAAITSPGSLAF